MRIKILLSILIVVSASFAKSESPNPSGHYPQWRGPNRDGISTDENLLKTWPENGPKVLWKIDTVGAGYSSVAIKDGIIVTMGDLDGVEHVIALDEKDGSLIWAVQPEPVAAELLKRAESEFANLDANSDGKIDELEALKKLGLNTYKYDRGDSETPIEKRAALLFATLDANSDGELQYSEGGSIYRDQLSRIDAADKTADAAAIAQARTTAAFKNCDANDDEEISKKESRNGYVGVIFSKADKRLPGERKGDGVLTRDEINQYFQRREKQQDGKITGDEFVAYYKQSVRSGDGQLSREELTSFYGGYRNGQGDGPRGTPTIDGDRVYTEGGNGDVTCFDLASGKTLWHCNLVSDFGGRRPGWGYSESPLIVNDWVIVTPGGSQGTVLCLNKDTGKVIWQSKEVTEQAHYSSPILATIAGRQQIVQFARESMLGVDLESGQLLWQYDGANNGTANCCTPVVSDDHVFAASAYGTGGGLAKITNDADGQKAQEVYFEKKMAIHHGGIIKIGDYLYSNGAGSLICINFLTGDIAWQSRSVGKGSLTAADGMLYVLGERQKLALVEATPDEYRERGAIELESSGRPSWAHPVVTGGVLYIRDQGNLTAYDIRAE